VGQLTEQILGYFRDMMAAAVGCGEDLMLHTLPADQPRLKTAAEQMGLETILAVVQIFDQAVVRMRQSTHGRVLLEMAVVRACRLENLDELSSLIAQVRDGASAGPAPTRPTQRTPAAPPPAAAPEKKSAVSSNGHATASEPDPPAPFVAAASRIALTSENMESVWRRALDELTGLTADYARFATSVAISAPNRLVVTFPENYNFQKQQCERPENKQKIEQAVSAIVGTAVALGFEASAPARQEAQPENVRRAPSRQQRLAELRSHPWVGEAIQMFDAEILKAD
jgi:DNA polymerase-3 subunit gamma/tau